MVKLFFLILFLFIFNSTVINNVLGVNWVDNNGTASWDDCDGSTPLSSTSACSLATATTNAIAGDLVYLRDGNYGSQRLNPSHSGSEGNAITFSRYQNETPSFTSGSGNAVSSSVNLIDDDYIIIDGLTFIDGSGRQLTVERGEYNEIRNCFFSGNDYRHTLQLLDNSHYTYIHDNYFGPGVLATIEDEECDTISSADSDYVRIINNEFHEGAGHALIRTNGSHYNIIRANTIYYTEYGNTATPGQSHTDMIFSFSKSNYTLVEKNVASETGTPTGHHLMYQCSGGSKYTKFRHNVFNSVNGWSIIRGTNTMNGIYNINYHNTYYDMNNSPENGMQSYGNHGLTTGGQQDIKYNQWVNNIVHTSGAGEPTYGFRSRYGWSSNSAFNSHIFDNVMRDSINYNVNGIDVSRNYSTSTFSGAESSYNDEFYNLSELDPLLVNPANGDFKLQSSSPAINNGGWLTTITSVSDSGTLFVVDNAYFFFDGYGIAEESGDTIKTENGQTATITDIDYDTNTLTVDSSISWIQNEGIALDYNGSAPDIGAKEYSETPTIRANVDQQNGINSTDAMLTLRNSLSLDMSQTAWQESATTGDVNCDGTSNSTDAMLILRHSVGLSMSGTGWCE